jgi:hypothetical protein
MYPGGKSGSGVYQTIINQMPPHAVYVEAFFGGGAVMKYKRPAQLANIAIDRDAAVLRHVPGSVTAVCADALDWLPDIQRITHCIAEDILVYCDPPYLMSTRSSQRPIYRYELEDADHVRLLDILASLAESGVMVMLSGYPSDLYDRQLAGWRRLSYYAMTRGGSMAQEVLWMSYPEPWELHDYRYLGRDFRERERIKRKKARWVQRLEKMDPQERAALMQAINQVKTRPPSPKVELLEQELYQVLSL